MTALILTVTLAINVVQRGASDMSDLTSLADERSVDYVCHAQALSDAHRLIRKAMEARWRNESRICNSHRRAVFVIKNLFSEDNARVVEVVRNQYYLCEKAAHYLLGIIKQLCTGDEYAGIVDFASRLQSGKIIMPAYMDMDMVCDLTNVVWGIRDTVFEIKNQFVINEGSGNAEERLRKYCDKALVLIEKDVNNAKHFWNIVESYDDVLPESVVRAVRNKVGARTVKQHNSTWVELYIKE